MVQHTCHNCGKELEPPRTKWCSDRCRMRFKRQGGESKKPPAIVVEMEKEDDSPSVGASDNGVPTNGAPSHGVPDLGAPESVAAEPTMDEPIVTKQVRLVEPAGDYVSRKKMVAVDKYNAVVVKNRELAVHVDLLVEERDKLSIQLGATQDRLIAAERDAAANSARLEQIPRLESELSAERASRREAERSMSAADAKLEHMIRLEADLANERVAHADTKRKYLDASTMTAPKDDLGLNGRDGSLNLSSPVSAGENAKPGIRIAPSYRQSQLSNFVILLLLFVIIILAALVIRFVIGIS